MWQCKEKARQSTLLSPDPTLHSSASPKCRASASPCTLSSLGVRAQASTRRCRFSHGGCPGKALALRRLFENLKRSDLRWVLPFLPTKSYYKFVSDVCLLRIHRPQNFIDWGNSVRDIGGETIGHIIIHCVIWQKPSTGSHPQSLIHSFDP